MSIDMKLPMWFVPETSTMCAALNSSCENSVGFKSQGRNTTDGRKTERESNRKTEERRNKQEESRITKKKEARRKEDRRTNNRAG